MLRFIHTVVGLMYIATLCFGQTVPATSSVHTIRALTYEVEQKLIDFQNKIDNLNSKILSANVQQNIAQHALQRQLTVQATELNKTFAQLTTTLVTNGNGTGTSQSVVTLAQELLDFKNIERGHILDAMHAIRGLRADIQAAQSGIDSGNGAIEAMKTRINSLSSGQLSAFKSEYEQLKGEVEQILGQHALSIRELTRDGAVTKAQIAANCACNRSRTINNAQPLSPSDISANAMFADMDMKMADAARALETVNDQISDVKTSAQENGEIAVRVFSKVNTLESQLSAATSKNEETVGALKKALQLLQRMTVHWISTNRQNITGIDQQLTELVGNVTALQMRMN